jgi:excisionase family DNA binding protein
MAISEAAVERADTASAQAGRGYCSLRELSHYSSLSVRTIRTYLSRRIRPLPHYRVGGKILVKRSEFDDWLEQFAERGTSRVSEIVDDVLKGF